MSRNSVSQGSHVQPVKSELNKQPLNTDFYLLYRAPQGGMVYRSPPMKRTFPPTNFTKIKNWWKKKSYRYEYPTFVKAPLWLISIRSTRPTSHHNNWSLLYWYMIFKRTLCVGLAYINMYNICFMSTLPLPLLDCFWPHFLLATKFDIRPKPM